MLLEISGCHFFSRAHIWHLQRVCRNGSQFSFFKFFGVDANDARLLSGHVCWSNLEACHVTHFKRSSLLRLQRGRGVFFFLGALSGRVGKDGRPPRPADRGVRGDLPPAVKRTDSRHKMCTTMTPLPPSPHLPP
jgi:hypothetical protein